MQPKIIKKFISNEMCNYLNNSFYGKIPLNDQGYVNIYTKENMSYYDKNHLFNTLNKQDKDEVKLYDTLNLILISRYRAWLEI